MGGQMNGRKCLFRMIPSHQSLVTLPSLLWVWTQTHQANDPVLQLSVYFSIYLEVRQAFCTNVRVWTEQKKKAEKDGVGIHAKHNCQLKQFFWWELRSWRKHKNFLSFAKKKKLGFPFNPCSFTLTALFMVYSVLVVQGREGKPPSLHPSSTPTNISIYYSTTKVRTSLHVCLSGSTLTPITRFWHKHRRLLKSIQTNVSFSPTHPSLILSLAMDRDSRRGSGMKWLLQNSRYLYYYKDIHSCAYSTYPKGHGMINEFRVLPVILKSKTLVTDIQIIYIPWSL